MPLTEKNQDDGNAFANFSFDVTGGSAKSAYYATSQNALDLQFTLNSILGTTDTAVQSGRYNLSRKPPLRHPKFPYLFASKISSLVGTGYASPGFALQPPTQPGLAALNATAIGDFYGQYNCYEVGVEFTGPRTYTICNDDVIGSAQSGTWYKPDGTSESYSWSPEFLRYTDFSLMPQDNTIQGQQGWFTLYKNARGVPFTSPPWMWLPDQVLKITWYQVPYRYILSPQSFIAAAPWKGRVNQNFFWLWPPGWILYLGYNVKSIYGPPTGFTQTMKGSSGQYTYFNFAQLCDIELNFLVTNRQLEGSVGFAPGNGNYVLGKKLDGTGGAGHNLLPDLVTNKFFYATRNDENGAASTNNPPSWLSAPLECLFSDPDVSNTPSRV